MKGSEASGYDVLKNDDVGWWGTRVGIRYRGTPELIRRWLRLAKLEFN